MNTATTKEEVQRYWESRPPGIRHTAYEYGSLPFFEDVERERYGDIFKYRWLKDVAEFDRHAGEKVLEVGMGLGTDILQFARGGAKVSGVDLTENSVATVKKRFALYGLKGNFQQADFRRLPFDDNTFDVVYSFGVLHHSPYMEEGIEEVRRVLKPGGKAVIMLYHKGFKFYVRKLFFEGVLKGKYLRHSTQEIINKKTEEFGDSPCTLVVNRKEARQLFKNYSRIESMTGHRIDDYLIVGKKWFSPTYMLPRSLRKSVEDRYGWNLVIKVIK
jgi:ubiquinone/menaquinone biosynthesis C-methylase UbiE